MNIFIFKLIAHIYIVVWGLIGVIHFSITSDITSIIITSLTCIVGIAFIVSDICDYKGERERDEFFKEAFKIMHEENKHK